MFFLLRVVKMQGISVASVKLYLNCAKYASLGGALIYASKEDALNAVLCTIGYIGFDLLDRLASLHQLNRWMENNNQSLIDKLQENDRRES